MGVLRLGPHGIPGMSEEGGRGRGQRGSCCLELTFW